MPVSGYPSAGCDWSACVCRQQVGGEAVVQRDGRRRVGGRARRQRRHDGGRDGCRQPGRRRRERQRHDGTALWAESEGVRVERADGGRRHGGDGAGEEDVRGDVVRWVERLDGRWTLDRGYNVVL